jgi:hypothetical protein
MINIQDYIKERTIQEVNIVHMVIRVCNNYLGQDGWYLRGDTDEPRIYNKIYSENIKDIELIDYREYDKDVVISFDFVNINNKNLSDYKELVDVIGRYIYDIRKDKERISTVDIVGKWLNENLEILVNKYR